MTDHLPEFEPAPPIDPHIGLDALRPAEITATRHLLGLSISELAETLSVSRQTIHDWERGRFTPRGGLQRDLLRLRAEHDAQAARLIDGAEGGEVISLEGGGYPRGWYVGLAARVIDRVPDAMIEWR